MLSESGPPGAPVAGQVNTAPSGLCDANRDFVTQSQM
jgi:hypothetical protein